MRLIRRVLNLYIDSIHNCPLMNDHPVQRGEHKRQLGNTSRELFNLDQTLLMLSRLRNTSYNLIYIAFFVLEFGSKIKRMILFFRLVVWQKLLHVCLNTFGDVHDNVATNTDFLCWHT
jgi:hypothetical protein